MKKSLHQLRHEAYEKIRSERFSLLQKLGLWKPRKRPDNYDRNDPSTW